MSVQGTFTTRVALLIVATVIAALTSTAAGAVSADERPNYILPCRRTDPEMNKCIKKSFNHLRPFLAEGIEELEVPPIEPLFIEEMAMENNAGAVRIKALFSNMTSRGPSNFTVRDVRSDINKLRIDLSIGIPRVEVRGKYEVIGNVLLLPVRSNGEFWAEFTDISSIAKLYGKEVVGEDGVKYMNIEKLGVDFTLKNARFKVRDNVNTGNILGEAINQFLNQNANELVQEMRPAASQSISKLFKKILDQAFSHIPLNTWLLDE